MIQSPPRTSSDAPRKSPSKDARPESLPSPLFNARCVLAVAVAASFFFCLSLSLSPPLDSWFPSIGAPSFSSKNIAAANFYVVVFDAGSTGTRIHVFQFEKKTSDDSSNDKFFVDLVDETFAHAEPGLSAYADSPVDCRDGLRKLLKVAVDKIPPAQQPTTPLILEATAGLRLLPGDKASVLLEEVRNLFAEYSFLFDVDNVSILDGVEEGVYGWITVNYLLSRLGGGGKGVGSEKVLTMDLGGGSTQITFDLKSSMDDDDEEEVPRDYVKELNILDENVRLYTRSYLGLGLMAGRLAVLRRGTFGGGGDGETTLKDLYSPCLPHWHDDVWTYGGVEYRVKGVAVDDVIESASTCFDDVSSIIAAANVDKIPRSTLVSSTFYAFSYYFDRLLEVGLTGKEGGVVKIKDAGAAARRTCRDFPRDKRPFLCMDLAHIYELWTTGFGFSADDEIFVKKKIQGKEASWSLGSAFSLI